MVARKTGSLDPANQIRNLDDEEDVEPLTAGGDEVDGGKHSRPAAAAVAGETDLDPESGSFQICHTRSKSAPAINHNAKNKKNLSGQGALGAESRAEQDEDDDDTEESDDEILEEEVVEECFRNAKEINLPGAKKFNILLMSSFFSFFVASCIFSLFLILADRIRNGGGPPLRPRDSHLPPPPYSTLAPPAYSRNGQHRKASGGGVVGDNSHRASGRRHANHSKEDEHDLQRRGSIDRKYHRRSAEDERGGLSQRRRRAAAEAEEEELSKSDEQLVKKENFQGCLSLTFCVLFVLNEHLIFDPAFSFFLKDFEPVYDLPDEGEDYMAIYETLDRVSSKARRPNMVCLNGRGKHELKNKSHSMEALETPTPSLKSFEFPEVVSSSAASEVNNSGPGSPENAIGEGETIFCT